MSLLHRAIIGALVALTLSALPPMHVLVRAAIAIEDSCIANASSCTVVPAGSDRVLFGIVSSDTASVQSCTTVVFNTSETLTAVTGGVSTGTGQYVQVYYLENPSATSATFSATGGTCSLTYSAAVALSGVDLSGDPFESVQKEESSTGSSSTIPTITSAVGDLVLTLLASDNLATTGFTRNNVTNVEVLGNEAGPSALLSVDQAAGAASVNASYTAFTGNRRHTGIGWNVPASGAAETPRRLSLLGVGEWLR